MDSDERRNKIIVGVVIIVVTVAIVALIVLKTSHAGPTCQLTDVDPKDQKATYKNIVSKDNKALAYFDGYLKYELSDAKDKKTFLPIELTSLETTTDKDGVQKLVLNLNCAQVSVTLKTTQNVDKTETVKATELTVQLSTANDKLSSCSVKTGLDKITYDAKKHFACPLVLVCENEKPALESPKAGANPVTVVTLNLKKLEFEIGGDEEKHKKLEFSTEADKCKP